MNYRNVLRSPKLLCTALFSIQTLLSFSENLPQVGQQIALDGATEAADGFSYLNRNKANVNLKCDSQKLENATVFTVLDAGMGRVAFWSEEFGAYLSNQGSNKSMTLNATSIGEAEGFTLIPLEGGTFVIQGSNQKYISTRSGKRSIRCSKSKTTTTAHFKWVLVKDNITEHASIGIDEAIERSTVGKQTNYEETYIINSASDFTKLDELTSGSRVIIEDGTYQNVDVTFECEGSSQRPVEIYARNAGHEKFTGATRLVIKGENAILSGLRFDKDGGPIEKNGVVQMAKNSRNITFENSFFNGFDDNGLDDAYWVLMQGYGNTVKYCSFQYKKSKNVAICVKPGEGESTMSIPREHILTHNYFGTRDSIDQYNYETIRIGDSGKQGFRTECLVQYNYFYQAIKTDNWLYEAEVISDKSTGNVYRGNVFDDCDGGLVLRHGQDCIVEENYFIGTGAETEAGIRVIGSGNVVKNNYLENIGGHGWRGALVLMDGRYGVYDKTYEGIEEATVSGNVVKNCRESLNFGNNEEEFNVDYHNPSYRYDYAPVGITLRDNCFYNDLDNPLFTIEPDVSFRLVSNNKVYSKTQNYGDYTKLSAGLEYQTMNAKSCEVPFNRVIERASQTGDSYTMNHEVTDLYDNQSVETPSPVGAGTTLAETFVVQNGYVVIEAEEFHSMEDSQSSTTWQTKGGYIEASSGSMQKLSNSGAEVGYDIYFPEAGTFYFHPKVQAASTSQDSLYFGLENGSVGVCHSGVTNGFEWDNNESEALVVPEAGVHRFVIRRREGGMRLDQFVLTTDSKATY